MRGLVFVVVTLVAVAACSTSAAAAETRPEDDYLRGYAAAVLQREFRITPRSLSVRNGVLSIGVADLAGADRARVLAALRAIPGVARVEVQDHPGLTPAPPVTDVSGPPQVLSELQTGMFPGGELFPRLIADPRWPHFSLGYQYYVDDADFTNIGAVTFGETFTFYRDRIGGGWWEIGVQAGAFAVFDLDSSSLDLLNTDYLGALTGAYRYNRFSALTRLFHQSSHVGDEFLLRMTRPARINLSYEGVDLRLSYEFGDPVRIYAGAAYLFNREPDELEPWSTQIGIEFRSPWPEAVARWRPIAAADFKNHEEHNWDTDISLRAGVQIDGVLVSRHLQLLVEYFKGHSPHGQFYRRKIDYIGLGLHAHF
jgi:Protein of unknown function (DUF1207)